MNLLLLFTALSVGGTRVLNANFQVTSPSDFSAAGVTWQYRLGSTAETLSASGTLTQAAVVEVLVGSTGNSVQFIYSYTLEYIVTSHTTQLPTTQPPTTTEPPTTQPPTTQPLTTTQLPIPKPTITQPPTTQLPTTQPPTTQPPTTQPPTTQPPTTQPFTTTQQPTTTKLPNTVTETFSAINQPSGEQQCRSPDIMQCPESADNSTLHY